MFDDEIFRQLPLNEDHLFKTAELPESIAQLSDEEGLMSKMDELYGEFRTVNNIAPYQHINAPAMASAAMHGEGGGPVGQQSPSYWIQVKREIYLLFCTDDDEYRELRDRILQMASNAAQILDNISNIIGGRIGIAVSEMAKLCAGVLYLILKIGLRAYCRHMTPSAHTTFLARSNV